MITVELTVLISLGGTILGTLLGILTYSRGSKAAAEKVAKAAKEEAATGARQEAIMLVKLEYVECGIKEIKEQLSHLDQGQDGLVQRVTATEVSLKNVFHSLKNLTSNKEALI